MLILGILFQYLFAYEFVVENMRLSISSKISRLDFDQ